jgi:hypothetical protein
VAGAVFWIDSAPAVTPHEKGRSEMDRDEVLRLAVTVVGVVTMITGIALVLSGASAWIAAVLGLALIGWTFYVAT